MRPVQAGDTVIVDLTIPGKKDMLDNFKVIVGKGSLNPDFENNLIGKGVGDKFSYPFALPANFPDPLYRNRSFTVAVQVKDIQETVPYKVDAQMAKVFNVSSVESCKEKFAETLKTQLDKLAHMIVRSNLKKAIGQSIDISVPESIFDEHMFKRLDRLAKEIGVNLKYPMPTEMQEEIKNQMITLFGYDYPHWYKLESEAVLTDIKATLFLIEYAKKHKIQVSTAELDQRIAMQATGFQGGLKEAMAYYDKNPQEKQNLTQEIFDEKIVKEILREVKVKEKIVSTAELRDIFTFGNKVNLINFGAGKSEEKKTETEPKKKKSEETAESKTETKPKKTKKEQESN